MATVKPEYEEMDTTMEFKKGRRGHLGLLFIIVLMCCLWASNPSPAEHRTALERQLSTASVYGSNSASANVRLVETMLTDQNFLFFSLTHYTRGVGDSQVATLGIGGFVIVLLPYDATVDTRLSFNARSRFLGDGI